MRGSPQYSFACHFSALLAVSLLAGSKVATAEVVLYDGFTGYTANATLDTVTPNTNTFGLGQSGAGSSYNSGGTMNFPTGMTISTDGLSLGGLVVSGGSVSFNNTTSLVASANITSLLSGSELWSSYLVNLTSQNAVTGVAGLEIRLNSNAASLSGGAYFRSNADTRGSASASPAVSYDNGLAAAASTALALNTTYIILSKFTSVGTADLGTASLWALNLSQFEAFVADGRTETFLNTTSNVTSTATVDTRDAGGTIYNWNTANGGLSNAYLEIVSAGVTGKFDEIRYGSTAADVTPVPEPTSALLGSLGLGLLGLRRRR